MQKRKGSTMLLQREIRPWREKQGHVEGGWEILRSRCGTR